MTADADGLTVSPSTVKWINLIALILPFILGGVTVWTAIKVNEATNNARFDQVEARTARNEQDIKDIRSDQTGKLDAINSRLLNIESLLYRLQGSLEKHGKIEREGPATLAEMNLWSR